MEQTTYQTWTDQKTDKIYDILTELGYQLSDKGHYWQSCAVYRGGDNPTALQIYKNSGTWKDYVKNTDFLSFRKLLELSCKDGRQVKDFVKSLDFSDNSFIPAPKTEPMEVDQFIDHEEVKTLLPHYSFYNEKKISDSVLKKYNGGFSMSGVMNGRFVFPVFDVNGKAVGLTGRHLLWKPDCGYAKWKHKGRKSNWIYPAYVPKLKKSFYKKIEETKEIIIVESIGDSLALSEQGYLNHMVTFGLDLSSKQIAFLTSLNIDKITIAINNDIGSAKNTGQEAAVKMFLKLAKVFDLNNILIKLPPKIKDFGEMLERGVDISEWIEKKINKLRQLNWIKNQLNPIADKKILKLIEDYIESLSFETDTIS